MGLIYILLGGLLARADGWGTKNPRWEKVADFFNAATCGGIFAVASTLYAGDLAAGLLAGLAFYSWRAPGFNQWENWRTMFWRGFWSSAIGFGLMFLVLFGPPYWAVLGSTLVLALLMGAAEALCYSGGYRWLPGRIAQAWVHPVIEIASGVSFTCFVSIIMLGL